MVSIPGGSEPVKVTGLSFTYRGSDGKALDGINFSQRPGEFVAIMGPTGAGKSTFCRCLNGIIPNLVKGDLQGEIRILGHNLRGKRVQEIAWAVGLVFQDFESQLFSTNVELEVAFGPENFCLPRGEIAERVATSLAMVGLTGLGQRDPSTLSGGEKQRLAIASVLAMQPRVLVMDEPTTDLDPVGKREVFGIIKGLRNRIDCIVVEHETEELRSADRIVIINEGRILAEGRPSEIFANLKFLEDNGIRPLQIGVLMNRLGVDEEVLTWQQAEEVLKDEGRIFDEGRFEILKGKDLPVSGTGEVIIDVGDLYHSYDGASWALNGLSLKVKKGEFVAVVGANGCGKTTLVKHFNGLLTPTRGKVEVLGRDTRRWRISELGRKIGYVFQNPDQQIFADTLWDEVSFGPKNFGFSDTEIATRVKETLKLVGLEGLEDADPFSLPRGERQKLAIASVLSFGPEVLILDEPTTGLDYCSQRSVLELLKRLNEAGHTIIIVTHSMWVVAGYARRCVVMKEGRIISDGTTREVFSDEELLASASIEVPEIVKLGNRFGGATLSVNELCFCLGS
ncbi:MAG TPA: energy-coupling factor ABC transporter ATP-binding protein [Candidatus Latescibacteria bacterium]|nr:energy-coupling factor ABC transporter ATP-binding protein [Candidatus Latescibacterota bacterium]